MDVMEAIAQRQSCRNFTGEKIGERELHVLLQAAQAAPVAYGDYSGVHIAVLQDPALLERLEQYAREEFGGEGPTALCTPRPRFSPSAAGQGRKPPPGPTLPA